MWFSLRSTADLAERFTCLLATRKQEMPNVDAPGAELSTFEKCEAVPTRARIQGSQTFESLDSRLESNKEADGDSTPSWLSASLSCVSRPFTSTQETTQEQIDVFFSQLL
jgi:hypothetical protein